MVNVSFRCIKSVVAYPSIFVGCPLFDNLLSSVNNKGFAKIKIGIARGKKNYDKRNDIKNRDNQIEKQ